MPADNLTAEREALADYDMHGIHPDDRFVVAKHLRAALARVDELEAAIAALRIEHEAHAALLTVTRGERDRLRPRHREAYEAGRKAGIEEAAKECDAAIADCEDCGSNDYMRAFRRLGRRGSRATDPTSTPAFRNRPRFVYILQFGGWWLATAEEWAVIVALGVSGAEWNYDDVSKRLSRRPTSCIYVDGGGWHCYRDGAIMVQPLDWRDEDWRLAAE